MIITKLVGEVTWHDPSESQEAEIERAFFRDSGRTLVLDFVYDSRRYYIEMHRTSGNQYSGSCEQSTRKEKWQVQAFGKLYSHQTEHVLVGTWREVDLYKLVVELQEIDAFEDESPQV